MKIIIAYEELLEISKLYGSSSLEAAAYYSRIAKYFDEIFYLFAKSLQLYNVEMACYTRNELPNFDIRIAEVTNLFIFVIFLLNFC